MALFDTNVSDTENRFLFISYFTFSLCATVSYFISFVSPSWIEAISGAFAKFNRIGLWTVCFDGYMRPNLYAKSYYGCFYIYYIEYDPIRVWLYIIQVIASVGISVQSIVIFILLCQITGRSVIEHLALTKWLMTGHFVSGVAMLCTVLGFLYGSYDSRWVPYPRYNRLSWGFATGIISLGFILISFFTMLAFYLKVHAKSVKAGFLQYRNVENVGVDDDSDVPEDDDRNVNDEIERLASTSASRMYSSQPSGYLQPRMAGSQLHTDADVMENLGNEDYDGDGIYPYV